MGDLPCLYETRAARPPETPRKAPSDAKKMHTSGPAIPCRRRRMNMAGKSDRVTYSNAQTMDDINAVFDALQQRMRDAPSEPPGFDATRAIFVLGVLFWTLLEEAAKARKVDLGEVMAPALNAAKDFCRMVGGKITLPH